VSSVTWAFKFCSRWFQASWSAWHAELSPGPRPLPPLAVEEKGSRGCSNLMPLVQVQEQLCLPDDASLQTTAGFAPVSD
jgi:hypothetical protein